MDEDRQEGQTYRALSCTPNNELIESDEPLIDFILAKIFEASYYGKIKERG